MADCGTCEASQKAAKDKASVCDVKGTCKVEAAKCDMKGMQDKATCDMKGAKDKASCEMKKMECGADCKKPCCAGKEMMDKSSEQAQEKSKKWWKFGFGK